MNPKFSLFHRENCQFRKNYNQCEQNHIIITSAITSNALEIITIDYRPNVNTAVDFMIVRNFA